GIPWPGGTMDVALLHGLLLLLILPVLLYRHSATFHYFCKVTFFNIWVLTMATLLSPFAAIRGRCVENMKLLCAAIRPLKHLYGIKIKVMGAEHLNLKEPYVIVCNHQASLDVMGMVEVIPKRCVPIAKKELLYMGTVGWACWLSGIIFIDRQRTGDAIDVISQTARTIRNENVSRRNWVGGRQGVCMTLHLLQVPIFPVVISPYWDFFSIQWRRVLVGRSGLPVLPRIETRGLSPKDVPELTETVRNIMVDVFSEMSANSCRDWPAELPLLPSTGATKGTDGTWHEEDTTGTSD
uniref:1-acylglycerol-3-phosphate O-acyltransferase n=1 Tax=Pavo cristatus TaxID=9049 RepID=A0A8C9ETQ8_PAVCR